MGNKLYKINIKSVFFNFILIIGMNNVNNVSDGMV